jgi:hypothetical protein
METAMTDKRTGGPAFPVHPQFPATVGCINSKSDAGMTLRDYFAAKAMQGLITCAPNHGDITHEYCAVDAYRYADAMLKARDGQP